MTQNQWNADEYITHAAFVPALANDLITLLNPQADERVLDLGCGDGALTAKLQTYGCQVIGIDACPDMVATARARGLVAHIKDGCALDYHEEFAAVFSNAALHWMTQPEQVLQGVYAVLKPGGRFCRRIRRGGQHRRFSRGYGLCF